MKAIYRVNELGIREVSVPDDYVLQAGELPAQPIVVHNPSSTEQLLMQQAQQITVLQTMVMQQNQTNAKLQATNAQQATQIKQLQQMFMTANQQQAVEKAKEVTAQ